MSDGGEKFRKENDEKEKVPPVLDFEVLTEVTNTDAEQEKLGSFEKKPDTLDICISNLSEDVKKEDRMNTEEEKENVEKGTLVKDIEPAFTEEIADTVGSIQNVKDAVKDAAYSIVQKVVTKIDNEIEKKVDEEERKDTIEQPCQTNSDLIEPEFTEEIVRTVGTTQDRKEHIHNVPSLNSKKLVNIESTIEEIPHNKNDIVDKLITKEEGIELEGIKKEKEGLHVIEHVLQRDIVEAVEKTAGIDYSYTADVDKKKNDTQKGIDSLEKKDIVEDESIEKLAVNEPLFAEETAFTVESIQDIKEAVSEKGSNLMQKIVDKVQNKIEENMEKEEWKDIHINVNKSNDPVSEPVIVQQSAGLVESICDILEDKTESKYIETKKAKEEPIFEDNNGVKEKNIEYNISVNEPFCNEDIIQPLESIQDMKDDVTKSASSIIQTVADKIEKKIEENIEREEWKDIGKDNDKNKILVSEADFTNEIVEMVEPVLGNSYGKNGPTDTVMKNVTEKFDNIVEEIIKNEVSHDGNEINKQFNEPNETEVKYVDLKHAGYEITGNERKMSQDNVEMKNPVIVDEKEECMDSSQEEDKRPITENELKMKAPSFTKLDEKTLKNYKNEETVCEKHSLSIPCALTIGACAIAVFAAFMAIFFYYN